MPTPISLTYKRGTNIIDMDDFGFCHIEERVWNVYLNGVKLAFISRDCDLAENFVYVSNEDHYICGGLTLTEAKETLVRIISSIVDGNVRNCIDEEQQVAQDILVARVAKA